MIERNRDILWHRLTLGSFAARRLDCDVHSILLLTLIAADEPYKFNLKLDE